MDGARDTVEELHLLGVKAFPYEVDVANYDEIIALKEKIKNDLADVDILINNAGLLPKISLLEGNPEDILRIFKVNLLSHFWVSDIIYYCLLNVMEFYITDNSSIFTGYDIKKPRTYCWNQFDFGSRINMPSNRLLFDEIWHSCFDGWSLR